MNRVIVYWFLIQWFRRGSMERINTMGSDPSKDVLAFEAFLATVGLTLERRETTQANGLYCLIQYADGAIAVRLQLERAVWSVEVAEMPARPDRWYQVVFLRELLSGGTTDRMSFANQLEFLKSNWVAIVERFTSSNRDETHGRLASLRKEYAKRAYPSWPDAVVDVESFLKQGGLVCQRREAPDGALGERFMQYGNKEIGVRVVLRGSRWCVEVADCISRPDTWYDLDMLQYLLQQPVKRPLSYSERFEFLKANWSEIVRRFTVSIRQDTHVQLERLKTEI